MKTWFKIFLGGLLATFVAATAVAQPVIGVTVALSSTAQAYNTNLTVTATAIGSGGAVGPFTYEFFVNGIAIPNTSGTNTTVWQAPQPGVYAITSRASDGSSNTGISPAIQYFATGTIMTAPASGTTLSLGSAVILKADATTNGGFIKQIQFFDNATPIGVADTTLPFSLIYTPSSVGAHLITAQATDNTNAVLAASAPITLNVVAAIGGPVVSEIASPSNGATIPLPTAGNNIPVTVNGSSPGALITKAELYIDGNLFGSDTTFPYTFNWSPSAVGAYTLTALVYDNQNNVKASGPSIINVQGPPTVAIVTPTNNSTVAGGTPVQLSANASATSPNTIVSVQFFQDGTFVGQATSPSSGTLFTIAATLTQRLDAGGGVLPSVITAVATDSVGLSVASTPVNVTITTGGGGGGGAPVGIVPTVQVTSPTAGTNLGVNKPHLITANAADGDGNVVAVQFFVNNQSVGSTSIYPYTANWTPTNLGSYAITAKVTDNDGNSVTSDPVQVNVGDPSPNAPVIQVTAPAENSILPVNVTHTLRADAFDDVAIASVQFFVNGLPQGSPVTSFPFLTSWLPKTPGNYTITARAFNTSGNHATSDPVAVVVSGGTPPTVTITSPANISNVAVNHPRTINAAAQSAEGTIANVQFFVNGVLLFTDNSYPYSAPWVPNSAGVYQLKARATDNVGNITDSEISTVTGVSAVAPAIAITNPTSLGAITLGTPTNVTATVQAGEGATIASVQFLANGLPIGAADTSFPYGVDWTPLAAGSHSLTAIATDTFGSQTTSIAVNVNVVPGSTSLPFVSLTSIASNTSIAVDTPVLLGASAGDPDGVITNVSFYASGQLIGSTATAPYVTFWSPGTPGTYIITAVATDNAGNSTTSLSAGIAVTPRSGAIPVAALFFNNPTVDTPAPGATAPDLNPLTPVKVTYGSKLLLNAPAVDQDGSITNVKFYANGGLIANVNSAPFFTVWQLDTLADVTLTALITDSSGNGVYTNPILIDTQPSLHAGAGAVALTSPLDGSTYGVGGQIVFSATHNFGTANPPKVDFYVDGSQFTTVTAGTGGGASAPYQFIVGLTRPGTYLVHAVARVDNTTTVSFPSRITITANNAPGVNITSPASGSSFVVGNTQTITASASDSDGTIQSVQFFVNGVLLSTDNTAPYTASWSPGATGNYTLTAKATDNSGGQTLSAPVAVAISNNAAPVVAITGPASGLTIAGGSVVNLTATASDPDGNVASVRFVANGNVVGTSALAPYLVSWAPSAAGTYTVVAQATDNAGNVTTSSSIQVIVSSNQAPAVTLVTPSAGAVVRVGTGSTVQASANDVDGTISNVQFFANGAPLGTVGTPTGGTYRTQWSPNSEGVYRITATALDNAGATTTSAVSTVLVVGSTGTGDVIATGIILGPNETGTFAAVSARGKTATFIGSSMLNGVAKTYYFSGVPVGANGTINVANAQGQPTLAGTFSETGVFGSLDNGRVSFSGTVAFPGAVATVAPGYYTGNLAGRMGSTLAGIVGADGSIALYVADGSFQAAGFGSVDATGAFNVVTNTGVRFTGLADPATGFLSGSLFGGPGGSLMAATSAGASFSDGFLRNLSTRGPVGTGANILIAGFVVGGNTPKRILIRAVGPTLGQYGVSGTLTDPQLQLFSGSTMLSQNDNWSTPAGVGVPDEGTVAAASASVGAFPLPSGSRDSVIYVTLPPGSYSAQVSGVNGGIGIALVEIYDVDNPSPFSAQKVLNVASRGAVGTNQGQLIAGFVISGNTPKKVLIRGVGPSLATVGIGSGFLADPILRLVRSDGFVIRENDNWESGNDAALVKDASTKVGAFALSAGSNDAAILINLPPGAYSAQIVGAGGTTGLALIEVYEAP